MGFNDRPRQGGFNSNFSGEPVEKHKAVCSECKKECEVPFKPGKDAEGKLRPVFCKDCYAKRKPKRY